LGPGLVERIEVFILERVAWVEVPDPAEIRFLISLQKTKVNKAVPIKSIIAAAAPPDQVPYVSALQVTPITLPPPISAVTQFGSPRTENPVKKKVDEQTTPIIFQITFSPLFRFILRQFHEPSGN
jgi:hypothetical protein